MHFEAEPGKLGIKRCEPGTGTLFIILQVRSLFCAIGIMT